MRVALELPDLTNGTGNESTAVRNSQSGAAVSTASSNSAATDVKTAADATASVNQAAAVSQEAAKRPPAQQLNLSFRKDNDGRVYYVVSDENGQVVREIPPEAVRHVGDGIAEYLKTLASSATTKTDTTA